MTTDMIRKHWPVRIAPSALAVLTIYFLGISLTPLMVRGEETPGPTETLQTSGKKKHRKHQNRPIQLGTSGGNLEDVTPLECCDGTLGALVEKNGVQYILSNNHVLARRNKAKKGEAIIQPGLGDQRPICQPLTPDADTVAWLSARKKVKFGPNKTNLVDAAIAEVVPGAVNPAGQIIGIGIPGAHPVDAFVGMRVKKSGRTTGLTRGSVIAVNASAVVEFPKKCGSEAVNLARFSDLIFIAGSSNKPFLDAGDSGSMVYENKNNCPSPVGLIFAGNEEVAAASPASTVQRIFSRLQPKGPMSFVGCQSRSLQSTNATSSTNSSSVPSSLSNTSDVNRPFLDEREIDLATEAMRSRAEALFSSRGVHSIGIGVSLEGNAEPAIYVFSDESRDEMVKRLPQRIQGYRVEVFEAPRLVAQ